MRGIWGLALVVAALAGMGCNGKPKREMRPPAVQMYDLPPPDSKQFSQAPEYPEDKLYLPSKQKAAVMPAAMGGGMGGGMPSPGMPGGAGGMGGMNR